MLDRRDFVRIAGAAGVGAFAAPFHALPRRRRDPIEELARRILETPRDRVLEALAPDLEAGLSWQDLLAAVFHAGLLEVEPRPVGFSLHCVMVVESCFQLAAASPAADRLRYALWNLDDLKLSQENGDRSGDWRLPPAPKAAFASGEAAASALGDALADWDLEKADAAIGPAYRGVGHERTFEILWPFALMDFTSIGHKPIHCSHIERVLRRLDGARAETALRALLRAQLYDAPGQHTEHFLASLEAAGRLGEREVREDVGPEASLELARELRPASPSESRELLAERLGEGLSYDRAWDAVRLSAMDIFARRPSLLPVHPTTASSAVRYIHGRTGDPTVRAVALFQAASWLPLYRATLNIGSGPGGMDPLVESGEREPVSAAEAFDRPSAARSRACLDDASQHGAYEAGLRRYLVRGVREHHEPKYAAAILEDVRTADPAWRPALLSPALEYLPSLRTRETGRSKRAAEVLERAGRSSS